MNNTIFPELWSAALRTESRDSYIAEWSSSSLFPENASPADVYNYLLQLWDGAHMTMRKICKQSGMTQAALAQQFCIPQRTMSDWCRGIAKPADYVRLMMLENLGLLHREYTGAVSIHKFEIHRSRTDCAKAYRGVTFDTNDHEYDVLESYDDLDTARAALTKYSSSYRPLGDNLYRVEEVYIVEIEVDEEGEDLGRYDIWEYAAE